MKAGIVQGTRDIQVNEVADPAIHDQTEVIVRVKRSCICGSDLWFYRGISEPVPGSRIGHEFIGTVEQVGGAVSKLKAGDFVIAPFYACDGTCPACQDKISSSCVNRTMYGSQDVAGNVYDGGQGQLVRVPMAEANLTVVPADKVSDDMLPRLLPLTDVLCTGHHAAVCAQVKPGKTVAVIGDGAVGLCAVAAAKRLGAKTIYLLSTHDDRAALGQKFGATDIINARGDKAVKQVLDATEQRGVDCVLESVGMQAAWQTAFGIVRAGGDIGFVGVPNDPDMQDIKLKDIFAGNVGIKGGIAPAADYIPELLPDVLSGKLDVSAIFTKTVSLDDLAAGYQAMDERQAIKTMVNPE